VVKKIILGFLLTIFFSPLAFSQSQFFDVKIVGSAEQFKMTDGDHKDLMGLYLEARPVTLQVDNRYGKADSKFQLAPFEIHVQGGDISSLKVEDLRAAVAKYLLQTNQNKSSGAFVLNVEGGEFHFENLGANEDPHRQLQIFDIALGKLNTGYRYTDSKGTYYVFGGIANLVLPSTLRDSDRDAMGMNPAVLDDNAKGIQNYNAFGSQMAEGQFGGYVEIANNKFKLYGASYFGTKTLTSQWDYTTAFTDKNGNPAKSWGQSQIYSKRFNVTGKVEIDLGNLLTKRLTGWGLSAAVNVNQYQFDETQTQQRTSDHLGNNVYNDVILKDQRPVQNFNQVQFRIGVSFSPNTYIKWRKRAQKFKGIQDIY
jgi:hypothetical protein